MDKQRAPQKRRLETRQKLIATSRELVSANGYAGFRVEDAVRSANVAKGTFFSHFEDRDSLLALLIGDDLGELIDTLKAGPIPQSVDGFCDALDPLTQYLARDRQVFDIIIRHSGALSETSQGPIAQSFGDQMTLFAGWIAPLHGTVYRGDVSVELLAEGVQAFMIQAVSLQFCAVHSARPMQDAFKDYLQAWLRCGN